MFIFATEDRENNKGIGKFNTFFAMKTIKELRFICILLCVSVLFTKVAAQETFFRTYEFNPACGNMAFSIENAEDGGFYVGGGYACQMFMNDWMFFKTDEHGDVQWMTRFASTMSPDFMDMIIGKNGNIYGVGNVYKYEEGEYFPGIGSVTPSGDSLTWETNCIDWDEACGYASGNYFDISKTEDDNFLLAGDQEGCYSGARIVLSKITEEGETLWIIKDTIYTTGSYYGVAAIEVPEEGVYLIGHGHNYFTEQVNGLYPQQGLFVKHDNLGNRQIARTYSVEGDTVVFTFFGEIEYWGNEKLLVTGGFIEGWENATSVIAFIYQVDLEGNILENSFLHKNKNSSIWGDDIINGIITLQDGGFLVYGNGTYGPTASQFGFMCRYNSAFEPMWYKTLGDKTGETFNGRIHGGIELPDERLAFTGYKKLYPENSRSFLLVTDAWGNGDYPSFERPLEVPIALQQTLIYPNPTNGQLIVDTGTDKIVPFTLFSLTGNLIKTGKVQARTNLDLSGFSAGIYVLRMPGYAPRKIVLSK